MPKSPNQKLKLLYLMEILLQQTDERHPMTVPEMIAQLAQRGVSAERKSIYGDLEALRTFGLDIVQTKSKTTGYYVGTRAFETPELKLLVDSVQSSSSSTTGTPRCARSMASASPTGPAPTTTTGRRAGGFYRYNRRLF